MCFDFQEYCTHITLIDAVVAILGVDTVVCNSKYFEHLGSEGTD